MHGNDARIVLYLGREIEIEQTHQETLGGISAVESGIWRKQRRSHVSHGVFLGSLMEWEGG